MTYLTIDFDDSEKYVGNRPKGVVILKGPGGRHGTTWTFLALVDTGADFMHLPDKAATAVGISLANAPVVKLSTAGGIIHAKRRNVDVEIQGVLVNVPVNFHKDSMPLIGRQAIFRILDTSGFSPSEWLLDWHHLQQPQSATSSTTQQPSNFPLPSEETVGGKIVDYGTWVSIGGIRLNKRGYSEPVR
jgi:hypothetical protein